MKLFAMLIVLCIFLSALSACSKASATTDTAMANSANAVQAANYPPKTEEDLHRLAESGNANVIHEFHSESVDLPGCPQPSRQVTVDPSITGQRLVEDLLAYFYAQNLDDPCGSVVFAYHDQSEAGNVYTVGRMNFAVSDSKYTLTLDVAPTEEYVVTY